MLPDWKALFPDLPDGPALDVGTRFGEFALRLRQAVAHALEKQGRHEAANLVGDAVHYFGHCNDKLEEALNLVKGEN